jgi:NitT/TauT family transport system substrate-binding protein
MRIAIADMISPSYFTAIAAVEFGELKQAGIDVELELIFPVTEAARALRRGEIHFLAGAAHAPLYGFPQWEGSELLVALSQRTYWFLVIRSDLCIARGNLAALHDVRIGAAPGVDVGLECILTAAGVDPQERRIAIGPVPGIGANVSFGLTAAEALADGRVDGIWVNGMGAEIAIRRGVGTLVMDARRGDGPPGTASHTFPALSTSDAVIAAYPSEVEAVTRAIVNAMRTLRDDPGRASEVGQRVFPPYEAGLIGELIARDAPYYDPSISVQTVDDLNAFARRIGLLDGEAGYHDVVAPVGRAVWASAQ